MAFVESSALPALGASQGQSETWEDIPLEAYWVLQRLALSWDDVPDAKNLTLKPLKGAMTNKVLECRWAKEEEEDYEDEEEEGETLTMRMKRHRKVLVRIYGDGTDLFFDRRNEVRTFEAVSRLGQGPCLLGRFPNGRIEEFLHARTLSASDLFDPNISALIAVKLREFHHLKIDGPTQPQLWTRLRDWLQKSLTLCTAEIVDEFKLPDLGHEIDTLQAKISHSEERIGFCHNDLQYGNIMMDEEDNSITIIDYEYASWNPVAYDIANHFCEMAADYHTEMPHMLDYTKYPGYAERCRFVEIYLRASGDAVSQKEIEDLVADIEKYVLACHIHWGLWGIISACVNEIEFDYMEYARQRFREYSKSKTLIWGT